MASTVTVARLAKRMNLQNLTEQVDLEHRDIRMPDINRPSLQFTGFWDFFEPARVQIIGKVEYTYLMKRKVSSSGSSSSWSSGSSSGTWRSIPPSSAIRWITRRSITKLRGKRCRVPLSNT